MAVNFETDEGALEFVLPGDFVSVNFASADKKQIPHCVRNDNSRLRQRGSRNLDVLTAL
jgi:Flp pilus assembly protein CpaB